MKPAQAGTVTDRFKDDYGFNTLEMDKNLFETHVQHGELAMTFHPAHRPEHSRDGIQGFCDFSDGKRYAIYVEEMARDLEAEERKASR